MKLLSLVFVVALLTACASTDESQEPMPLVDFTPQAEIDIHWSTGTGAGQDKRYTRLVPAVADGRVYAVDIEGTLVALDKNTGKRQWRVKLDEPVSAGVSVAGDTLFVGTYNAEVIALDTQSGEEQWRAPVVSEVLSTPRSNGSVVAVQTFNGVVVGLDHDTGEERWSYETNLPVLTLRGNASPVFRGNSVYTGFANGKVVSLNAPDGAVEWDQRVALPQGNSELEKLVDVDGSPLVTGEIVFAASYQGKLLALSRSTGRPLWEQALSTYSDLAVANGNVYVSEADGRVRAFRVGNGQEVWSQEQLLRRKLTAPQVLGDYLVVGDEIDGYLHVLDQEDGTLVARRKIQGDGLRSPPVTDGERLYVLGNGGKLVALTIEPLKD